MSFTQLAKRAGRSHLFWLIALLWSAGESFAQTPLPCGQPVAGSIDTGGEEDRYTFDATQGDMVLVRLVSTTDKFDPQLKLFDPEGQEISVRLFRESTLNKTGAYTVLVSVSSRRSQTGTYEVSLQRTRNPCHVRTLACGAVQTSYIERSAQLDAYTFTAAADDSVLLRLMSTIGERGTDILLMLYDPEGRRVHLSGSPETARLTQAGAYTVLVANVGTFRTGNYQIALQQTKHPCNPTRIAGCLTAAISMRGEWDAFTFDGAAGRKVMVRLESHSPDFYPEMNMYDPDGLPIGSFSRGSPPISETLRKSGEYTVLVNGGPSGENLLRSDQLGSYTLGLGNVTATLLTPRGGEMFLIGSVVPIKWKSSAFDPVLASHDILLSTDGGTSYPTTLASALPANIQSFEWNLPADLRTTRGRIQIVARDSGGNACRDESGADIALVGLPQTKGVTYKYDELNRLIQVIYEDGTTVTYTYDAAGNRLTERVSK